MQPVEAMSERILYWLMLNIELRALVERLLEEPGLTIHISSPHAHTGP